LLADHCAVEFLLFSLEGALHLPLRTAQNLHGLTDGGDSQVLAHDGVPQDTHLDGKALGVLLLLLERSLEGVASLGVSLHLLLKFLDAGGGVAPRFLKLLGGLGNPSHLLLRGLNVALSSSHFLPQRLGIRLGFGDFFLGPPRLFLGTGHFLSGGPTGLELALHLLPVVPGLMKELRLAIRAVPQTLEAKAKKISSHT
jgi:hypothetical protein